MDKHGYKRAFNRFFSTKKREKLLVCIPLGGLNDNICQIEKCWQYAEKSNRKLLIKTKFSNFMDWSFTDIFTPKVQYAQQLCQDSTDGTLFNKLNYFVAFIKYRIKILKSKILRKEFNKIRLSFDFTENHSAPIIYHRSENRDATKSRVFAKGFLERVTLSKNIRSNILNRLEKLPSEYVAIHIRNTDIKTNVSEFFSSISDQVVKKNILVCSDDTQVIETAKTFFNQSMVFTITNIPNTHNQALHIRKTYKNSESRKLALVLALTDLLALGYADQLFFTKNIIRKHKPGVHISSGFSDLAKHLFDNKHIIDTLLNSSRKL